MEKLDDAEEIKDNTEFVPETDDRPESESEIGDRPESESEIDNKPGFESANKDNRKSKSKAKDKSEPSLRSEIISWILMIVTAFVLAVIIDKFIIVNATVPTGSMENTIMTGSRMIGFRFAYLFGEPKRGDIVVFKYPLNEKENYVKRIIGLPGETVYIEGGKIYIQKKPGDARELLEENYLKEDWKLRTGEYKFEIPKDGYLMLGDNRNHSADARVWGEYVESHNNRYPDDQWDNDIIYVRRNKILGKAVFTYWPLNNIKILK